MDYDSIEAVDFFLAAVRNHRATTVQERAANLYETEMHQRRMELDSRFSTSKESATCCK